MIYLYFVVLIASFAFLFKFACYFVDGAIGIAKVFNISKMVIGIVLVGMATTAPEFFVSVISAFKGKPEFALGNAIGSVICDDGVAMALAAVLAPAAILINCRLLKIVGIFLLAVDFLAYFLAWNGTIGRLEGVSFVLILILYYFFVARRKDLSFEQDNLRGKNTEKEREDSKSFVRSQLKRPILKFFLGLTGVLATSHIVVWSAERIAVYFSVPEIIIGLTVLAIGTSLPEISTCITAALKGEGEIAVGNIIGADILNVLWIIGVSSIVNPIRVDVDIINFTFPFMILIVATMLGGMRIGCRIGKLKGFILFGLYIIYIFLMLKLFT